jgi:elongation factor 3
LCRIDAPKKVKKLTSSEARKAKKERMARKKLGLASDGEDDF